MKQVPAGDRDVAARAVAVGFQLTLEQRLAQLERNRFVQALESEQLKSVASDGEELPAAVEQRDQELQIGLSILRDQVPGWTVVATAECQAEVLREFAGQA